MGREVKERFGLNVLFFSSKKSQRWRKKKARFAEQFKKGGETKVTDQINGLINELDRNSD